MKIARLVVIVLVVSGLFLSVAFAAGPEDKGKALFNDPKFAGGSKACASCHPNGKGLENAADKKEFRIMGKTQKGLEEAVNFCIENASKGKAIDPNSADMKNIVAYIKSLKKGKSTKPAAGY